MTRNSFRRLAVIVAQIVNHEDRLKTADSIADLCAEMNPRFDRDRFAAAVNEAWQEIEAARRHATGRKSSEIDARFLAH